MTPTPVLRVAIVDDEPLAREALRSALAALPAVEVSFEAEDGPAAVSRLLANPPDLVFLDVRMPGMDGFGVLSALPAHARPVAVFVTAHDDHAVRAFEVHAVDYLVKPFDDDRLAEAVTRGRRRLAEGHDQELARRLERLLAEAPASGMADDGPGTAEPPPGGWHTRVQVRRGERIRFVDVAAIRSIETDGNHVILHLDGATERIRHTLKDLLAVLDPKRFVRIHRSTAVNLDHVREVQPWFSGDYVAIMDDGRELRVSRHYMDGLLRASF